MQKITINLELGPGSRPGQYEEVIQSILDGKPTCNRDIHLIAIKHIMRAIDFALYNGTEYCSKCGATRYSLEDAKRMKTGVFADDYVTVAEREEGEPNHE